MDDFERVACVEPAGIGLLFGLGNCSVVFCMGCPVRGVLLWEGLVLGLSRGFEA